MSIIKKRILSVIAVILIVAIAAGIFPVINLFKKSTSISLDVNSYRIATGDNIRVLANAAYDDGYVEQASSIQCSSSDEKIFIVKNGVIKAVSAGTATLIVTYKGVTTKTPVTVDSTMVNISMPSKDTLSKQVNEQEKPVLYGVTKGNSIILNWKNPKDTVSYDLYKSTNKDGSFTSITNKKTANLVDVFSDDKVSQGVTYYYKVKVTGKKRNIVESNVIPVSSSQLNKFNPLGDDDGDGVTNEEELIYGTSKDNKNTNGASDAETVQRLKAGQIPGLKANIVEMPTVPGKTSNVIRHVKTIDNNVDLVVHGNKNLAGAALNINEVDNDFTKTLKGIKSKPVDLSSGGIGIESAEITMSYDPEKLDGTNENNLCIYWLDDVKKCMAPLSNIKVDTVKKVITGTTKHFSTYVIGDSKVLGDQVTPDSLGKVDIIFALERSSAMASKDPNNYGLKVVQSFADGMDTINKDPSTGTITDNLRIGLISFSEYGKHELALTNNSAAVKQGLNGITYTKGGTNIEDAMWLARNKFVNDSTRRKIIVLVTETYWAEGLRMLMTSMAISCMFMI